jgi:oxygen-independent coproporphyrinogen-3 oxidase
VPPEAKPAGLYLSFPFCKHKCSFCNFASDVFSNNLLDRYIDRLCTELREARQLAATRQAILPETIDTIYFGGGTPSLLAPELLRLIFQTIRSEFTLTSAPEITLEAAPNQLSEATLEAAQYEGVNRISFGVQSFIDKESAAVGRTHTAQDCAAEIARLRAAGIPRISLDLIAGLPYQTAESWRASLDRAIATETGHISIYLLEIDQDSRLGRESLAQGPRYHAPALPSEDATADWYESACRQLASAGIGQYEISNFARPGHQSRHNRKYWQRDPYLGVGLDAHSMLPCADGTAIRWANPDAMPAYLHEPGPLSLLPAPIAIDRIDSTQAFEESLFLGLRLNEGISLESIRMQFGPARLEQALTAAADIEAAGLLTRTATTLSLTPAGRIASNEVFSRLLVA